MSELIQSREIGSGVRRVLLAGASVVALAPSAAVAGAQDGDHPTVWIELGGQLNHLNVGFQPFAPDFTSTRPGNFSPSQKFEKPALYGFDEVGKLSFQPEGSGWVMSATIRYGRSSVARHVRQQNPFSAAYHYEVYPSYPGLIYYTKQPAAVRFADTMTRNSEQHAVVDFQVGKDVGLGLFGQHAASVVSAGVRFAQFTDSSNIMLKSDPDWRFELKPFQYGPYNLSGLAQPYHSNAASFVAERSFRGLGPSLSWNSSASLASDGEGAELDLDWGVNGAVLFGRQKAQTQHQETVLYNNGGHGRIININFYGYNYPQLLPVYQHTHSIARSRSVVVPNIGGFAGLSFKYDAAKVSFGYRGDFFFGAMDGGIDARKTYGRNFFGPYASISVGLGD